mgnify:CR=1 FL=1
MKDDKIYLTKNRSNIKKLVFSNGCFDILHIGHIRYLSEAKKLGTHLVIGLNSDESVKKLKGKSRPINNVRDRLEMLKSLKVVDSVIIFNEITPINLIKDINPDILVKGGDYDLEKIVGYDYVISRGGSVKTLKFHKKYSTSKIIENFEKIK